MNLSPCQWSPEFAESLDSAFGDSDDLEFMQREVEAGISKAWIFVDEHGKGLGSAVTRWERDTGDLVVCAYQGCQLKRFAEFMVQVSRALGVQSIRFHTQKPGLIRLVREFDPEPLEYVVRINTDGILKE